LNRTGIDIVVNSGVSLLEALEARGVPVPNLCRQGVCGECRIPVADGAIEHRDLYLTDAEKHAGDCMMPCVSRAGGERLELDL
ncbi:MAG: 2Fe-2S iron-sulfur cluster binding domain-containing protein, partial [Rhodococcus ruber]|nr:2Fe-2S iron-sulfur cluster binding domain-containing protein [Rhodococcus ruber]